MAKRIKEANIQCVRKVRNKFDKTVSMYVLISRKIREQVNFVFKKCIFFSTLLMLTAFLLLIMTSSMIFKMTTPTFIFFF
jgi:hypothetical protein